MNPLEGGDPVDTKTRFAAFVSVSFACRTSGMIAPGRDIQDATVAAISTGRRARIADVSINATSTRDAGRLTSGDATNV